MTTLPHCLQYDYRLHRGWFRGDFLPLQARSRTAASQEQNRISRKIRARFRSLYSTLYCTYMLQFYVWYSQHDQCLCSRMYWIAMFSPSTTLSLQVLLIKIKFVVSGANHMPIQGYHTSLTIIIYIYIYICHIYVWIMCKTDKILSFRDFDGETAETEYDMFRFPCGARRVFKMHFWFVFLVLTPHTASKCQPKH